MRLTNRGKIVVGITVIAALWGLYELVNHIWWTGTSFCWGDIYKCEGGL